MLQCNFLQSAILSVTLTYIDFPKSINSGESIFQNIAAWTSYGAKAAADCCIPELMKFRQVIFWRRKNAEKSIWSDKAISSIRKSLKMVLCSSCDGVPLNSKRKQAGLQFRSADRMSLVSTTLRICLTLPLNFQYCLENVLFNIKVLQGRCCATSRSPLTLM
jgi:hypothetical protein